MSSQITNVLAALAGQPNCGKSTVFNALTGASQHVANYPGVTVDKMVGRYRYNGHKVELVDLPGTYSLTSYSPEERVSRDFILHDKPAVTVNVMDASNLKRCLYLTFQLLEMETRVVLTLNMMDVAEKRGLEIDVEKLAERLGIPVVATVMKTGRGKQELLDAIAAAASSEKPAEPSRVDYGDMEPFIRDMAQELSKESGLLEKLPLRWTAIKLMEGDGEVRRYLDENVSNAGALREKAQKMREEFEARYDDTPEAHIANRRYMAAADIARSCVRAKEDAGATMTDRIDRIVCNKFLGPLVLIGVIWLLYYLSIVQGYNVTNYTWPLLAKFRVLVESVVPAPGFIEIPLLRAFALWFVDSINALLNYIPIFFILFGLIAILEDCGYMPRMAFIMDRLFSRYGLHGQSTLPMVLGGIYVGGCAVPGVMSCKGIPDERSRLATILIIPMLNCLAKVPLYVLLINIYFAAHKAWAMFFISTISLLLVLPVSKLLTMTALKDKETAPFVMEMPPYHMPMPKVVLARALERVWLFVRKITTIVAAVAVVIFVLLQFPGIGEQRMEDFRSREEAAKAAFFKKIEKTSYADKMQGENLMGMVLFWEEYKDARMGIKDEEAMAAMNAGFEARNPVFFKVARPGGDREAKTANREFKKLVRARMVILQDMRKARIDSSFLGRTGKWIEPVTQWAGFNWRVNVALLSALAAKESSVATLGALYDQQEDGETLEARMARGEEGFTALHALALMLFMVLYPPCLATAIAVKLQAGSAKWMLFSMAYPMCLGLMAATAVYSGGTALGLSGIQAMFVFYGMALAFTIFMGFLKNNADYAAH